MKVYGIDGLKLVKSYYYYRAYWSGYLIYSEADYLIVQSQLYEKLADVYKIGGDDAQ